MKQIKFKGIKLLLFVILIFAILAIMDTASISSLTNKFLYMLYKVSPIFSLVIIITAMINYFLKPKQIMKHFGEDAGKMGTIYALIGGMLSHGPMYAWYPMLSDMREHGLRDGLIATFMYGRAIKIPLLPFMIAMFGLGFTIIVNVYILLFAILQGILVDKLMKK
ncbi:MAG TPA: permease [Sulfurovum sp.]|nr:permease [Sulfurovum sp.]